MVIKVYKDINKVVEIEADEFSEEEWEIVTIPIPLTKLPNVRFKQCSYMGKFFDELNICVSYNQQVVSEVNNEFTNKCLVARDDKLQPYVLVNCHSSYGLDLVKDGFIYYENCGRVFKKMYIDMDDALIDARKIIDIHIEYLNSKVDLTASDAKLFNP